MADLSNIVCISTVADKQGDFDRLYEGLAWLDSRFEALSGHCRIEIRDFEIPPRRLDPKEALNSAGTRVELEKAEGRISRSIITPYPPGIPVICPGEAITADIVEYILQVVKAGGNVCGLGDKLEIDVVL